MKHLKQGIAAFLAVLLIMPALPAAAEETVVPAVSEAEQVWFNTGHLAVSVIAPSVSGNEAYQTQWMDMFAEDGSYTIEIPEENPFFPYEVQFTCGGETINKWFMSPDDTVEVGGHTFRVNAHMDGTAITQMSMNIAGKEIVVYPEEKEFTNDSEAAVAPQSITYDLTTRNLTVDLTGFTPVELTRVKIETLLAGSNTQIDKEKIAWTIMSYSDNDDYTIGVKGDVLDLSYGSAYAFRMNAVMIVGEANQLDQDDKKYDISVSRTASKDWLTAEVYQEDVQGNRIACDVGRVEYQDWFDGQKISQQIVYYENKNSNSYYDSYIGFKINPQIFALPQYASLKAFAGQYTDPVQATAAPDITAQIFSENMAAAEAGYKLSSQQIANEITLVSYDTAGNVTGCLPLDLEAITSSTSIMYNYLYDNESDRYVTDFMSFEYDEDIRSIKQINTLYAEYPSNGIYSMTLGCSYLGTTDNAKVTAAYVGNYNSIAEAQAAGATDIKDSLFNDDYKNGYYADYSQGVVFSCFIGQDGDTNQIVEKRCVQALDGTKHVSGGENIDYNLSSDTAVQFYGLVDANKNQIPVYTVSTKDDTYGEYNYHVMMVAPGTDLHNVAPIFSQYSDKIKLYAEGSNSPEISGNSYHDLSGGVLQYTASAEDGKASKNYWLKVIQANNNEYPLFISSLTDESAKTKYEDGVIYSTREVMIDSYHNDRHDIFLANIGNEDLQNIKAELDSDTLEIGDYWELDGRHNLGCYDENAAYRHNNVAKLRIVARDGVAAGTEVNGKLTISAAGKTLMVLTLTGIIGDPVITTKDIPAAVKYIPYGTMIQNSNKYSWNRITYVLWDGSLPEGVELKPNGEIYGVPKETGSFTFTVRMENNYSVSEVEYTLNVLDNTNENVEKATDAGYGLKERVQTIYLESIPSDSNDRLTYLKNNSQRMVSQGEYAEYVAVYLDGEKLEEGEDYTSEEGSTRITLTYQTLLKNISASMKSRTLAIEFREKATDTLKRAAQNFEVSDQSKSGPNVDNNQGNSDSGSNSNGGNTFNSGSSSNAGNVVTSLDIVRTVTYTVQPGDTLSKIAKKFMGNASLWRKIYEDNRATIKNPNRIHVGQTLVINLSGVATTEPLTDANTYVVRPGDNLWKIAKKVYGQGFVWRKIFEANRNIIANPGNIHVGQRIVTP